MPDTMAVESTVPKVGIGENGCSVKRGSMNSVKPPMDPPKPAVSSTT